MIKPNKTITTRSKIKVSEDVYGVPVYAFEVKTFDALVAWGSTGLEYGIDRNVSTSQGTVYVPLNATIAEGAEIIIDGEEWRQAGEGMVWSAPAGFSIDVGQVVPIEKVEG